MNSTAQRQIDDATLSAWIDQALASADMIEISKALQQQPELQQRLTAMLCNDRKLQQHYTQMAQQPVPAALQALLQTDVAEQASPVAAAHKPARSSTQPSWQVRLFHWLNGLLPRPVMAAAGLLAALGLGLLLGEQYHQRGPSAGMTSTLALAAVPQAHPLHSMLESAAAGAYQQLDAHTDAVVDLTFQHSNGDYCRQFRIYDAQAGRGNIAVACRQQQGWQLQLAQSSQTALMPDAQYHAASGPDTALMDSFIMQHSNGDIMVGDAEQQMIENGWTGADQQ